MTQPLPPGQHPIDPRGAFGAPQAQGAPGWPPGPVPPPMGGYPGYPPGYPPIYGPMWPRRRHPLLKLIVLVLLVGVGVAIWQGITNQQYTSKPASPDETTIVSGDPDQKVAIVPIDGLIDDASRQIFDQMLTSIEKDSSVKAVVVELNTPGGEATASDEMYHRLNSFKQTMQQDGRPVKVTVAMRDMATSGGYYIACAGDYIFAEPGTLTGNIGVLMPRFNFADLLTKYGIKETTMTATTTGHSYKNAGSMFEPPDPRDEQYLQGIIDGIFAQFKAAVNTGRGAKLNDLSGDIFSGKAFLAADALTRGLIDKVDYPEKAYDYAASTAGLSKPTIVRLSPHQTLLQQLMQSRSTLPPLQTQGGGDAVTVNGVSIDAQTIQKLLTMHPMMLWHGN